jgi:hypothetical protein
LEETGNPTDQNSQSMSKDSWLGGKSFSTKLAIIEREHRSILVWVAEMQIADDFGCYHSIGCAVSPDFSPVRE